MQAVGSVSRTACFALDHGAAIDGHGVGGIGFQVATAFIAREDQVDGQVDQACPILDCEPSHVPDAFDVCSLSEHRIQLARFQRTTSCAVEHGGELMFFEQPCEGVGVFGVAGHDARSIQSPSILLPNADHLSRIA